MNPINEFNDRKNISGRCVKKLSEEHLIFQKKEVDSPECGYLLNIQLVTIYMHYVYIMYTVS